MLIPQLVPVRFWGNQGLEPESAIAVSGGFSWNPIRPLSFEADYWNYYFENAIAPESATDVLQTGDSEVLDFDPPLDPVVAEGPVVQQMNLTTRNSPYPVITDGIDFGVLLKFDQEELGADIGTFRGAVTGTYTLRFLVAQSLVAPLALMGGNEEPPHCDERGPSPMNREEDLAGKRCDIAGHLTGTPGPLPVLRANFPVSWDYEGHLVAVIVHYTSGMDDDARYDPMTGKLNEIDPWTTVDLQYGYTIEDWFGESLSLRAGVYNIADADPPFVDSTAGFTALVHDPRGRVFFTKVIGKF
jgi:outer membrane receptor protein involved in Fe transport